MPVNNQAPLPDANTALRLVMLASKLIAEGATEAEIKIRCEEEIILANRENHYERWLSKEHALFAHGTARSGEDNEDLL